MKGTVVYIKGGFYAEGRSGFGPRLAQNGCAIVESAARDLAARLEHDQLLSGNEGEHSVRRGFGVFDEIAVDGKRAAVQARQFDHVGVPSTSFIGRDAEAIRHVNEVRCQT